MNSKSPHILNTSSNLLGFSFLVLTSIKGLGLPQDGWIDEIVAICVVIFSLSCFFSFLSMRAKRESRAQELESLADYVFLAGLSILTIVSILFALGLIAFTK